MILTTTPFDVDEPEGSPKSSYISLKDLRMIAIVLLCLSVLLWPVYKGLKESRDQHLCQQNFLQISKAFGLYSEQNDDRLPPTFVGQAEGTPMLDGQGRPFTWASLVAGGMNSRSDFVCPSADPSEIARTQDPESTKKTLPMTYGMYGVYGGYPIAHIGNPDEAVLVAETSNFGAEDTFDPMPFKDDKGAIVKQDGFVIGYSDTNDLPTHKTTAVTRLAYPGSKSGTFSNDGGSRHANGIFFLTVGGSLIMEKPPAARIKMLPNGDVPGPWSVPPMSGR